MAVAKLFCALDAGDRDRVSALARAVAPSVDGFKLGLEFFCAQGPDGVRAIAGLERPIFLDLKLHDIPNTVAGAVRSVMALGPAYLTLHAAGGGAMLRAAADAARAEADHLGVRAPALLAVTVLTSLDGADLADQGIAGDPAEQVARLAILARGAGIAGIVASPREIAGLRAAHGNALEIVVPGIRPRGAATADQKRTMTPGEAVRAGADALVVGRPITAAADPADAARQIRAELAAA